MHFAKWSVVAVMKQVQALQNEVLGFIYPLSPHICKIGRGSFNLSIIHVEEYDFAIYYCALSFLNIITFGEGTILLPKERDRIRSTTVLQEPVFDRLHPGDSVTLQCSVISEICAGEYSVYWFRHSSGYSQPGIIYTHNNRSDQCMKRSENGSSTQSCVYSLPKTELRSSDAGIYYCAVDTCGKIHLGNGTELTIEGEDTFELHALQSELEAVEKQIHDLLLRQAELRDRCLALETSRADAHKSVFNVTNPLTPTASTPCVPQHRSQSAMVSFTPAPTRHHEAWVVPQRKTRVRFRPRLSPTLPVFELSTQNRFSPLRETERDAVIIGDSIVRHVHATLGKSKVHSHCFPGARVSEIAARVPEILNGDERVGTVVLHAGVNDIRLRQTEILKKDFRNLIDTVRSTSPETTIIVSGPLPTLRKQMP
ncbi:unnamed protein product [Leuciscus chuanchicus]